jgi:hypothetical protein
MVTHHIIHSVFTSPTTFSFQRPPLYSNNPLFLDRYSYSYTHTYIHTLPDIHLYSISPHLDYLPIHNEVPIRIPRPLLLPSLDIRFGKRRNPQFLTAHNLRMVRRLSYICAPNHRSRYHPPPPLLPPPILTPSQAASTSSPYTATRAQAASRLNSQPHQTVCSTGVRSKSSRTMSTATRCGMI